MSEARDVVFPLTVTFENGETEVYRDQRHLEGNLEEFDSEEATDCEVRDALGRRVFLKLKSLEVVALRLAEQ